MKNVQILVFIRTVCFSDSKPWSEGIYCKISDLQNNACPNSDYYITISKDTETETRKSTWDSKRLILFSSCLENQMLQHDAHFSIRLSDGFTFKKTLKLNIVN